MGLHIIGFSVLAGALAVANLLVSYFWPNKWAGLLPILSYVSFGAAVLSAFYDVAPRAEAGDSSGLLDIYPAIVSNYVLVLAVVTVFNVLALAVKGRGKVYQP